MSQIGTSTLYAISCLFERETGKNEGARRFPSSELKWKQVHVPGKRRSAPISTAAFNAGNNPTNHKEMEESPKQGDASDGVTDGME